MKYLLIFCICLAYQTTLKLFSMEEKEKKHLTSSLPNTTALKTLSSKKLNYKVGKLEELPEDFKLIDPTDKISDVFNLTHPPYVGTTPPGTDLLITSLLNIAITSQRLNPVLVKIVGPSDVGKTTLIRFIAQRTSNKNSYLEINLNELLLDSAQNDSYKSNPEKYIESLIKNFYEPMRIYTNNLSIIAFTTPLRLKKNGFRKLRDFLLNIQRSPAIGPLIVLHEGEKVFKSDGNYHDNIIYIEKPSLEHIKNLLGQKFNQYKYVYEKIEDNTIQPLEGSLPPYIQRIAEQVLRNALAQKKESITNQLIQETLQKVKK